MAAIDMTRSAHTSAPVAKNVAFLFTSIVGAFASWNEARVTRKVLNGLTDRELDDIGLIRGDIDDVAERRF